MNNGNFHTLCHPHSHGEGSGVDVLGENEPTPIIPPRLPMEGTALHVNSI